MFTFIATFLTCFSVLNNFNAHAETPPFSSPTATEAIVQFDHLFLTDSENVEEVKAFTADERQQFLMNQIYPTMKFLFGPATHRALGGPKREEFIAPAWEKAYLRNGKVVIPYHYKGVWILANDVASKHEFDLPVPYSYDSMFTAHWQECGDSAPEHRTESFFWYFWDPARFGCDHVAGREYDVVKAVVGEATPNETLSFPEYDRLIHSEKGQPTLSMTIAFGYVSDNQDPHPETDMDAGTYEYRDFLQTVRRWSSDWNEEPIRLSDYLDRSEGKIIGRRFTARLNGVETRINVVINAGIDQMELFAKSFAHDHDGLFAWMGHSRVGSGFDASQFRGLMRQSPAYYSISSQYQMIYWGGCNSYSYYTLPFFQFKAKADPTNDPKGIRNLDIIAHGLPSFFSLNSMNAQVVTSAVLNWQIRTSYQDIVKGLERNGRLMGTTLLAAVLGDEDNPK